MLARFYRSSGRMSLLVLGVTVFSLVVSGAFAEETDLADRRGKLEGQVYRFGGNPGFQIHVPAGCKLGKRSDPNVQVVSLRTPAGITVEASVAPVDEDFRLSNGGPFYFGVLSKLVGENHELLEHKKIDLGGGVTGYRTDMTWTFGEVRIHTVLVSALAEGHWVFVAVHPTQDVNRYAKIAQSLTLDK